ncbi:MAG: glycosyltransferase family 2 protein [Anaerolineae bacterium]
MKLSVIIPVYNEASTLAELLSRVYAVAAEKEVLIVDDGSDLATKQLLASAAVGGARLFTHEQNRGKGAGIRTALEHATGDVVIIQDADLEYFPEDYPALLRVYQEKGARAVYGARDLSGRPFHMRWGNKLLTLLTNLLYGGWLSDMETCYKLVDRRLMQSLDLQSRRFEIEAEITAKLRRLGVHIYQTPIRYDPRDEDKKKLTPWDGIPALRVLLRYRFWRPSRPAT